MLFRTNLQQFLFSGLGPALADRTNSSDPFPLFETGRFSTPSANGETGCAMVKSVLHPSSEMTARFTRWYLDHRMLLGNHNRFLFWIGQVFPKPFVQTSYFGVPRLGPVWSHDCVVGSLLLVEMSSRLEMMIVLVRRIRKLLNQKFILGFLLGMLLSACSLEIFRSDTAVDMASIRTIEQNKAGQWRRTIHGWELIRCPLVSSCPATVSSDWSNLHPTVPAALFLLISVGSLLAFSDGSPAVLLNDVHAGSG